MSCFRPSIIPFTTPETEGVQEETKLSHSELCMEGKIEELYNEQRRTYHKRETQSPIKW